MTQEDRNFDLSLRLAEKLLLKLPIESQRTIAARWIHEVRVAPTDKRNAILNVFLQMLFANVLVKPFNEFPPEENPNWDQIVKITEDDLARAILRAKHTRLCPVVFDDQSKNEYVACQKIPEFGLQFYYAFSKDGEWQNTPDRRTIKTRRPSVPPFSPIKMDKLDQMNLEDVARIGQEMFTKVTSPIQQKINETYQKIQEEFQKGSGDYTPKPIPGATPSPAKIRELKALNDVIRHISGEPGPEKPFDYTPRRKDILAKARKLKDTLDVLPKSPESIRNVIGSPPKTARAKSMDKGVDRWIRRDLEQSTKRRARETAREDLALKADEAAEHLIELFRTPEGAFQEVSKQVERVVSKSQASNVAGLILGNLVAAGQSPEAHEIKKVIKSGVKTTKSKPKGKNLPPRPWKKRKEVTKKQIPPEIEISVPSYDQTPVGRFPDEGDFSSEFEEPKRRSKAREDAPLKSPPVTTHGRMGKINADVARLALAYEEGSLAPDPDAGPRRQGKVIKSPKPSTSTQLPSPFERFKEERDRLWADQFASIGEGRTTVESKSTPSPVRHLTKVMEDIQTRLFGPPKAPEMKEIDKTVQEMLSDALNHTLATGGCQTPDQRARKLLEQCGTGKGVVEKVTSAARNTFFETPKREEIAEALSKSIGEGQSPEAAEILTAVEEELMFNGADPVAFVVPTPKRLPRTPKVIVSPSTFPWVAKRLEFDEIEDSRREKEREMERMAEVRQIMAENVNQNEELKGEIERFAELIQSKGAAEAQLNALQKQYRKLRIDLKLSPDEFKYALKYLANQFKQAEPKEIARKASKGKVAFSPPPEVPDEASIALDAEPQPKDDYQRDTESVVLDYARQNLMGPLREVVIDKNPNSTLLIEKVLFKVLKSKQSSKEWTTKLIQMYKDSPQIFENVHTPSPTPLRRSTPQPSPKCTPSPQTRHLSPKATHPAPSFSTTTISDALTNEQAAELTLQVFPNVIELALKIASEYSQKPLDINELTRLTTAETLQETTRNIVDQMLRQTRSGVLEASTRSEEMAEVVQLMKERSIRERSQHLNQISPRREFEEIEEEIGLEVEMEDVDEVPKQKSPSQLTPRSKYARDSRILYLESRMQKLRNQGKQAEAQELEAELNNVRSK